MIRSDQCHSCQVCGRPWARFNYKAVVCDNCRVFFFRKITLNRQYKCHNQDNCFISPKVRVNCSACRYRRCLEANMDPEEVGKRFDKRPAVQGLTKKQMKLIISLLHEPMIAYGCKVLPTIGKVTSAVEFINIMIGFERFTHNFDGPSPIDATANMNISLGEAINNPALCCNRDTAAFAAEGSLPRLGEIPFWKIFCRALTSYLDFISGIEEIQKLEPLDKLRMCQYNYLDFVKYNIAYLQYQNKKKGLCMTRANFLLEDAPENFWDTYPEGYSRTHRSIVAMFEELEISQEEAMFLKIIGLLAAPPNLSEQGYTAMIQAKERYCILLGEYIRETRKDLSKYEVITRVRRILAITSIVKENCIIGMMKQAEMVMKGYGKMQSMLGFDVHIRSFF